MSKLGKIKAILKNPRKILLFFLERGVLDWMPDYPYLKVLYWIHEGKILNLQHPITLKEKMQWLKLYNRKTEYTMMVDKYEVKKYIASIWGDKYIIPTIGVWDTPEEINFEKLQKQFVLKCNHISGFGMCICKDKEKLNLNKVRKKLRKGLRQNYYKLGREWPYKNVKRKIICEQYLENEDGSPLVDYKFYCFGGEPRYFMYSLGEADHNVRNHKFDMNLHSIDYLFKRTPAIKAEEIVLPNNIDEMIEIVKVLCKGFPHIRIDLYNISGKIYFGEMTFYTSSGFINIDSEKFSQEMADLIDLNCINNR